MTSQEYCKIAVAALEDRKAEDVKIIAYEFYRQYQKEQTDPV